jgi:hypothetical protein
MTCSRLYESDENAAVAFMKCVMSGVLLLFLTPSFQVWFQNARAKWRRVNAQGGGPGGVPGTPGAAGGSGLSMDGLSEENCDSDSMTA